MKYIYQKLPHIFFLFSALTSSSYAANEDVGNADANDASTEETSPEVPAEKPVAPVKTAKPSKGSPAKTSTPPPQAAKTTTPATPMLSHRINDRLQLGVSLGFASIKPSAGSWQGLGFSSVTGAWKGSSKVESSFYISGRYTPYAGVLTVEHEDYDAAMHGFFVGPQWQLPIGSQGRVLKAGLELGYLLVYAKPQDRYSTATKAKENKVVAGGGVEFAWMLLENVQLGPFLAAHAGSTQIYQGGVASSFLF